MSTVSAHPGVRAVLVARQRDWVEAHGGGVVEGRDIGTVVFPDAPVKVFLTASDDDARRPPRARRSRTRHATRTSRRSRGRPRPPRRARLEPRRLAACGCRATRSWSTTPLVTSTTCRPRSCAGPKRPFAAAGRRGLMFYRFWRSLIVALAYAVFGVRVRGRDRIPNGVFILAPSHRSTLDIPFSASVTGRRMRFMAKREIFHGKFWTWVFDELGAVPVDRDGGDRAALPRHRSRARGRGAGRGLPGGHPARGRRAGSAVLRRGLPRVEAGRADRAGGHRWERVGARPPRTDQGGSRACASWSGSRSRRERTNGTIKRSAITSTNDELRARLQACLDDARKWSAARNGRPMPRSNPGRAQPESPARASDASTPRSSRERAGEVARLRRDRHRASRRRPIERGNELAQLARRREVLVLVGDVDRLDAVDRVEARDDRSHQVVGRARAGGDSDDEASPRNRRRARRGRRRE